MSADIANYIKSCEYCAAYKATAPKAGKMGTIITDGPWSIVGIDFVGPFPATTAGNKYVMSVTCLHSRWANFTPTVDMTAETAASVLVQHIEAHGLMDVVLSDRGAHFDAKLINLLCVRLGIKRVRTTPYHPQGNARTERVHRFLNAALGILTSQNGKEWDKYVGAVGFAYRSSPMPGTTLTPYDIFRGWPAKTPLDAAIHDVRAVSDDVKAGILHTERLHQASAAARIVTQLRHERNKAAYDAVHKSVQYKTGDKVMVFFPSNYAEAGSSAKLTARWTGPYTVVDDAKGVPVGNPDDRVVYSVRRDGTDAITRVHVARMKALVERRQPLRRPDRASAATSAAPAAPDAQPQGDIVGQESPIAELPRSLAGYAPQKSYDEGTWIIYYDPHDEEEWAIARVISDPGGDAPILAQVIAVRRDSVHVHKRSYLPAWVAPTRATVLATAPKAGWQPLTVRILRRAVFVAGVTTYYNKLPSDLAGYLQRVIFKDTLALFALEDALSDGED